MTTIDSDDYRKVLAVELDAMLAWREALGIAYRHHREQGETYAPAKALAEEGTLDLLRTYSLARIERQVFEVSHGINPSNIWGGL